MGADDVQSVEEVAPREAVADRSPVPTRHLTTVLQQKADDWRPLAKRIGAAVAALAALGAVLSGLTGYWSTYKVVVGELFGIKPAAQIQTTLSPQLQRLSIAVMPFENLSGDTTQDYFCDGIVENLTSDLSINIPHLLVISSASSLTYKGQKIDPRQVGRELNVRYLLQGSVLRTGSQVRINARLIDAETGEQLWVDRLDGDTTNVIALQDQVTARISTLLHVALVTAGARQAQTRTNPDAFDLTLRAQAALNDERRMGVNPRSQTEEFYRKALALDPDSVDVEIGLAGVLAENLMNTPLLPPDARPSPDQVNARRAEILRLLQKASARVDSSEARVARSHLYFYDRRLEEARKELDRALAINPNNASAIFRLATNYLLVGEPERALPWFDEWYVRTAGKTSSYRAVLGTWGSAYLLLGRWDEAAAKFEQARALFADPGVAGPLAVALLKSGKSDAAKTQYDVFQRWYAAKYGAPPTIKRVKADQSQFSLDPNYLKLYDAIVLDGFRNLGMPEE